MKVRHLPPRNIIGITFLLINITLSSSFLIKIISFRNKCTPPLNRLLFMTQTRLSTGLSSSATSSLLDRWLRHTDASFHDIDPTEAKRIRSALLTWYRQHRRRLPWRGDPPPWNGSTAQYGNNPQKNQTKSNNNNNNKDDDDPMQKTYPVTPYGIWVSEIMLQQTRVEAVIPKWCQWMHQFPTVVALANATPEQINAIWAGLGYYRRARFLHDAAKQLVAEQQFADNKNQSSIVFPTTAEEWQRLPGIGRYTASAIASIAYGQRVPVVDGNVCRVLSRLRAVANTIQAPALKDTHGWNLAAQIVQIQNDEEDDQDDNNAHVAGEINQALMELGATHCGAPIGTGGIHPDDPLREFYWSTQIGSQAAQRLFLHTNDESNQNHIDNNIVPLNDKDFDKSQVQNMIEVLPPTSTTCPICATHGIQEAWENLQTCLSTQLATTEMEKMDEAARRMGHSIFPLAPTKKAKREEVWAVAVIASRETMSTKKLSKQRWLMVQRPQQGLLAGQWEFPAALVWTSDNQNSANNNKKLKRNESTDKNISIPKITANIRSKALDEALLELCPSIPQKQQPRRKLVGNESIDHVFSHVRHTMYIEHAEWTWQDSFNNDVEEYEETYKQQSGQRQVRWLCESDMQNVGVTSGVKKILKWVKQHAAVVESSTNGIKSDTHPLSHRNKRNSSKSTTATRAVGDNVNHKRRRRS